MAKGRLVGADGELVVIDYDPIVVPKRGATEKTELLQAALGVPTPLCYGRHIVGGQIIFQQLNSSTNETTYMVALGEGEWEEAEAIWVNGRKIYENTGALNSTTFVHFHPGLDGELGSETDPATRNQKICSFWPPLFTPRLTFSRLAYVGMYLANDIDAPDTTLDIRGSYKTRKVRLFDDAGTQTAYMYSANPAWCILDLIIHRIIKPHGLINEALTADEKTHIDFESFYEAAQYCAADPGDGNARFECHVAFTEQCTVQQALNQMLLTCRGYIIDRNGKIALFVDKPRSSVYTVTRDMIADGSLTFPKKDTRNLANSLIVKYRHLESGNGDVAKDFQSVERECPDPDHQDATGREIPATVNIGNSLPGRALRLGKYMRDRSLKCVNQAELVMHPPVILNRGNRFDRDPSCMFVGNFASVAGLAMDSSGKGNHLTNVGVTYDNGAKFVRTEGDYLYRPHASLAAGFPGTVGYTDLAIYSEFTLASLPADGETFAICSKYVTGQRSFWLYLAQSEANYYLGSLIGYNSGANWEYTLLATISDLSPDVRYGVRFSFNDTTKAGSTILKVVSTGATVATASATLTNNMFAGVGNFYVGRYYNDDAYLLDGTIHKLYIFNEPKTEADFDAMAAGTYGRQENFLIDLLPGDVITGPSDVDAFETRDYEVLEISDEPDGTRQAFLQEYKATIFHEDLSDPTLIYPTEWDLQKLNPSGGSGLSILTHRDDPTIPPFGMAFEFTPDNDNGAPIEGVAVVLMPDLPGQGPYYTQRTQEVGAPIIYETGICQVVKGLREVVVSRSSAESVVGKVFCIYSADASPDTDLDGNIIYSQAENRIKLTLPFEKSGLYSYFIMEPWWPPNSTTNTLYQWFSIDQLTALGSSGTQISVNEWGSQGGKWRTPTILAPAGVSYATVYSRNKYGFGSRLTAADPVIITYDGIVTQDTDNPSGCSNLQILTNDDDERIPRGCMAFRFNRDTENYHSIMHVEVAMGTDPPLPGPYPAQIAAHPEFLLASGTGMLVTAGSLYINFAISDPVPGTLNGKVLLLIDEDKTFDGMMIETHGEGFIKLTKAFYFGNKKDEDGEIIPFDWVVLDTWWDYHMWVRGFKVPEEMMIADVEEPVWQTIPVPLFEGEDLYAECYTTNIWGLSI